MKIIKRNSDGKLFQPEFYYLRAVEFHKRKWWQFDDKFVKLDEAWYPKDGNEFSIVEVE